jgi:5-methylcytosine-specific restriction endonuclease McrA
MFTTDEIRVLIAEGRTAEFYNSKGWRRLSHKIIRAAHGECRMCSDAHRLTPAVLVHHIKHLREHPELAYTESNLMPLCHDCHERIHRRGIYATREGFSNEEKW